MNISYIPAVSSSIGMAQSVIEKSISKELFTPSDGGVIQKIIEKAIENAIVIPFTNACVKGWIIFVEVGGIVTLFIAMAGLISYIGGVKKGKSIAVGCATIHLILQLLNYFIMG